MLPTVHRDSLLLTVNPDRSVGVGWNTTITLPLGSIPQNLSSLFPAGYAIHSSSSFTQQANAVVQTSTTQYQLPQQLYVQQPALNLVNSITLTATQTGSTSHGSLMINTNLPVQTVNAAYSTSSNLVSANATVQLFFSTTYKNTPFENQTAFQTVWTATFANATWRGNVVSNIQNSANHILTVTAFNGTLNSIGSSSANVSIRFAAIPSGSATDFVTALEIAQMIPAGVDPIIRSALSLITGASSTMTYTGSTHTVVIQSTTNYVLDLDSQVNRLKAQFFQFFFSLLPAGTVIPPAVLFLNATSVTISKMSTTSDLDLSAGTSSMTLQGLAFRPPTVGTNTNFTIPGLFQAMGVIPAPGVNITLAGGSNATYTVKVVVPTGTPSPSSTTTNSATWTNMQNASSLSGVRFVIERLPSAGSFLDILVSPTGILLEAIIAAAIIAGILLYLRKKRLAPATPVPTAGPTPAPELGPGPTPPTP